MAWVVVRDRSLKRTSIPVNKSHSSHESNTNVNNSIVSIRSELFRHFVPVEMYSLHAPAGNIRPFDPWLNPSIILIIFPINNQGTKQHSPPCFCNVPSSVLFLQPIRNGIHNIVCEWLRFLFQSNCRNPKSFYLYLSLFVFASRQAFYDDCLYAYCFCHTAYVGSLSGPVVGQIPCSSSFTCLLGSLSMLVLQYSSTVVASNHPKWPCFPFCSSRKKTNLNPIHPSIHPSLAKPASLYQKTRCSFAAPVSFS